MKTIQKGFTTLEMLLVLVIALIIGFTAYYVFHSKNAADNSLNDALKTAQATNASTSNKWGAACQTQDKSMNGKRLELLSSGFSFCVPDGWSLTSFAGSGKEIMYGSTAGIVYKAGTDPQITSISSSTKGGQYPFFVVVTPKAVGFDSNNGKYANLGAFTATGISGTKYQFVQPDDSANSSDTLPTGTTDNAYYFEHGGQSLQLDYVFYPGGTDQTAYLESVFQTVQAK